VNVIPALCLDSSITVASRNCVDISLRHADHYETLEHNHTSSFTWYLYG